ncbi:type III pantothenate kinase [Methylophilus sp.]|jgi:type III pantothenate kinase|uniref:type III pantothenate kinase n=1 Tax=Methylophilus sp. TaxID=29541 RepID=UPI0011D75169|nr:type III pantothenate kinase [Methylophilus sp.]TXI44809.1 MAG: type III pantothenate kinase [Methylophilus sp.]
MKLLIDAGNTRTKWAWCPDQLQQDAAWQVHALTHQQWLQGDADAQRLLQAIAQAKQVWLSNVAGAHWLQLLPALAQPLYLIQSSASALGVKNSYHQPAQLGSDRWCSVLAVWQLFGQSALVVTAGTAMTMDALLASGTGAVFAGGSIQPGLRLMWQSLQQGAAQLDYAYPPENTEVQDFAQDSQQAIWQGCVHALAASVAAQFERLLHRAESPPLLILNGGDAALLHRYLPDRLSAQAIIVDNLVLKGLACLAEHTDK